MAIRIYNSLSRKKEEFVPIKKGRVGIYGCGPTVYDEPHIGHARSAYVFDVIRNHFAYSGYKVKFVRNITDVDDKIIEKARAELKGESRQQDDLKSAVKEVATKYLRRYYEDMARLGIKKADIEPKATEYIEKMIKIISGLIEKGFAYVAGQDVYFDIRKFSSYGALSGQSLDKMELGSRVHPGEQKKDPLDFALWKAAKPEEPSWKSPWGMGRPGWHMECSAMSMDTLGENFDIHGGGIDLIFPHHENEIAQSECYSGKRFANYWIHNGLLTINGEKMAKSLGNFISIEDILNRYHPEVLKLFFLSGHYRSPIDFTYEEMENTAQARETFYKLFQKIDDTVEKNPEPPVTYDEAQLNVQIKKPKDYKECFISAMDDDFNMSAARGFLYMVANDVNRMIDDNKWHAKILTECKEILLELGGIFGLFMDKKEFEKKKGKILIISTAENIKIQDHCNLNPEDQKSKEIIELILEREKARRSKNYKVADEARKKLLDKGVIIEDTKEIPVCREKI